MKADQFEIFEFNEVLVSGGAKRHMGDIGAKSRDLYQVPVQHIHLMPNFNVRVKDEAYHAHIEELASSMLQEGFYQDKPLAGYVAIVDGVSTIYLTDGHCRLDAANRAIARGAAIETVPMVIKPNSSSIEDLTVALVTSNSGKRLTPFELGLVAKRLEGFGWDQEKIASRLLITEQYVEQLLMLMGAPLGLRQAVQAGQMSAANAVDLLRKHGAKAEDVLAKAQLQAAESGSSRVTSKHLPGARLKKVMTKQAPIMRESLRQVRQDPAYVHLSEETRQKLEALLATLAEAESNETTSAADGTNEE